jgi:hypothetical protein
MSGKEKISRYFFHHRAEIPCIYYTFLRSPTRIPGPIKPVDRTNKLFGVPLQLHALLYRITQASSRCFLRRRRITSDYLNSIRYLLRVGNKVEFSSQPLAIQISKRFGVRQLYKRNTFSLRWENIFVTGRRACSIGGKEVGAFISNNFHVNLQRNQNSLSSQTFIF